MKPISRSEAVLGLVIPLVVVAGLVVLALNSDPSSTWIAFLAAVPMFSAMFARVLLTGIVALVSVLAAAVSAAATYDQQFADALPVLVGVIIGAGAAVMASQAKVSPPRRSSAPSGGTTASARVTAPSPDVDDITGLPTRVAVLRDYAGVTSDDPRVLALIDCDGLAAFNDEHGRDVGDVFLFAVGGRTQYALGDDDLVARWEGDELLVVIHADPATIAPTLQLITDKVNVNPIRTDVGLVKATISVGAAPWRPGESFDDALTDARGALYRAKAQGPGHLVLAADDASGAGNGEG